MILPYISPMVQLPTSIHRIQRRVPYHVSWPRLALGSAGPSVATLEVDLAALGYLPVVYPGRPSSLTRWSLSHPPAASWHWRWRFRDTPDSLKQLWSRNQYTVVTQGAVMQFQSENQLPTTGVVTPQAFSVLAKDVHLHRVSRDGYGYVIVRKNLPERLTLWFDGRIVLSSLANTGIPQSPTPNGTWPVYLRYLSQDMSGINPFGVPYNDPGVPYVNYFNGGDAVHGFVRASYGWPQSLGCVELPIPNAKIAWGYIQYGTLVTVES
jgi:peptidoglycan hydrolase-like protein with peptidoglycan-binding domain